MFKKNISILEKFKKNHEIYNLFYWNKIKTYTSITTLNKLCEVNRNILIMHFFYSLDIFVFSSIK